MDIRCAWEEFGDTQSDTTVTSESKVVVPTEQHSI
jgi:hypothetical protein